MNNLENTDRGNKGFRSTGVKITSESVESEIKSKSISKTNINDIVQNSKKFNKILMNEPSQQLKKDPILQRRGK